ncbi:bifunctional folylpolyglutamate synthase/dihydrofolate synthase [Pontibacillus litoralis]|uniref:Dihydrofolate synthase/folylpolyglutamate synthase n=1 Tax=Pontibacillus litoralis JSM 072002 TaxID=1385512 RepID=A0A0A5GD48_9BACI|nr:folylpolyglutamate synthase/dihydrofolate synthase family protein [Pontibacillus litoralis]KGX89020.1 folylpolyglutamate synthase [Pontibacillus litoralis JSM 072002]
MNIEQAIEWIQSRLTFGMKPGLERMEYLMKQLHHPEQRIRAIHVAGTNGKGSTVTFMRHILQEQGYQVGTFTSPSVVHFNDRICINGKALSDEEWIKLVERLKPIAEHMEHTAVGSPTEFEVITAMALDYFANHPVDYVLIETGLGGRLDSTNVIKPIVSVITSIGKDHTAILGDELTDIATEKAGIMKQGIPAVCGVEQQEALNVIERRASDQQASLYAIGSEINISNMETTSTGEVFTFQNETTRWNDIHIQMKGAHQVRNAALAIQTILLVEKWVQEEAIRAGLAKTSWPGRFEQISSIPVVMLDGAHNEEGIQAMVETVNRHFPAKNKYLLFSALQDKPLVNMLPLLDKTFAHVMFTSFEFPRAASAQEIASKSSHPNKKVNEHWQEALLTLMSQLTEEDVLIVSGSLYFIGEVRAYFHDQKH